MKNLILSSVLVLIASSAVQAQQAVQWKVSDGGNGHWYQASSSQVRWSEAVMRSIEIGGHLATIQSASENDFVTSASTGLTCWIGGSRAPNTQLACADGWNWITGEVWSYTNWNPAEPNGVGGCSELLQAQGVAISWCAQGAGEWNDHPGDWVNQCLWGFVTEWSADCNNDGIADYGQCRDGTLPDYNGNNVPDCCEQDGSCIGGDYPVQWREGDRANGHWYGVVRTPGLPWSQARAEAVSVGGDLASAPRAEVNAFIGRLIRPYSPWGPGYWLGGRKVDGEWAWVNGESWSFVSWGSAAVGCNNQPDGRDAVDIYCFDAAGVPRWSDDYFQWPNAVGFVIEWSADCNNDGIVDKGQILKGQLVDADANGVPDVCEVDPCPGDITNGGTVDATDLSIVLAAWGTNGQGEFQADIDNSGLVDGGDLALVLGGWGPCPQ